MTCHNVLLKNALEQAELIRSSEISARELLELHVRQYKKHHDQINAVIFTRLEEARATADQLDEELRKGAPRGPLHGVTMTVKDSYDLLGTPSTWGIPELRANFPDTDSLAVTRLKEAGLVIYGKTNVPYRIADWQSFNAIYGTTNNPWNLERTPGGSSGGAAADVTPGEEERVRQKRQFMRFETGYSQIQGTKPQTLGYGLNDSPAGLAAWIVEKFRTWSDCQGDVESQFTKDELLTNIMIYWVTRSITSSTRVYYETRHSPVPGSRGRVEVPVGCAIFPRELVYAPRKWAAARYNITHWTEMPRGGHFAAMEEPELLVDDVRKFFRRLRRPSSTKE